MSDVPDAFGFPPPDDPNADPRIVYETVEACLCGTRLHPGPVWGWGVCPSCYTWVNTRRPTEASLPVVYGPTYWGTTQRMVRCPPLEQRFESDALDRVPQYLGALAPHLKPGARVAEVGCGNGRLVHELRRAGFDAVGTEFSPEIIARVRKLTDAQVLRGGATDLERGAYDALVSIDVFEHAHDPRKFLREHAAPLKPRGLLMVHTPVHDSPYQPYTYTVGMLWKPYHLYLFGRRLAERLFREAGFEVVSNDTQVFGWPVYVLRKEVG